MKYIVASDYDGTLHQYGTISIKTIEVIKEFRDEGHLFGVVTGRDYTNGFEMFLRNNAFPFDFIIANNGASAYDKDGNIYFAEYIDGSKPYGKSTLVQELINRCLQLTSLPCGISFEKTRFDFHPDYPSGAEVDGREYSSLAILEDVNEFVLANAMCSSRLQATDVAETLRAEFGCYLNPLQNGACIDISAVGVDKSTGVAHLADCLGIAHENIWTAGDNFNDVTMLEKFHGCAMSHGVKEAITVAEYVCDNVADVIKIILENG